MLHKAVADELWAVHQYMYFHFHCDDQGFDPLAALFKKTAVEEMLHVEGLAERILFPKGDVVMTASRKVEKTHDVSAMLEKAVEMEPEHLEKYGKPFLALQSFERGKSVSKPAGGGGRY